MNLKFLVVLTMVLCTFCVLPVNAASVTYDFVNPQQSYDIGTANNLHVEIAQSEYVQGLLVVLRGYSVNNVYTQLEGNGQMLTQGAYIFDVPLSDNNNNVTISLYWQNVPSQLNIQTSTFVVYYNYGSESGNNEFIIDIDENEQIIEMGLIDSLEQTFVIGSSSNRVVKDYLTYSATSCTIEDLQRNYVKVKFNKNFLDDSEIYLSGYALKDSTESEFNTYVRFNFTYIDALQAFIQTYDYQNGNMLSGVNISVYEVIENDNSIELGNLIFKSSNAESQIILNLKQYAEYFVKNEKNGYFSVKNTVYESLNNETGYLWNPSLQNPLRLYYSKLDPTAQYNANFIVQDVNNIGISGVSVTMDNSVTKITNNIGGVSFSNVTAGAHTFIFSKNGYQTAQRTIDIQLQYAAFTQTLFKENQIVQPTVSPSEYPTIQPTVQPTAQPTISPIEKPSNLAESVKYGLAKMFGVNSQNTINLIFALMIILFPAVIGGVITHHALGFVSGGLIGFVFALAVGLIPIWVFFSMVMLSVIYLILTHTQSGF